HESKGPFVATLSGEEKPDWGQALNQLTAGVSPDGRYVACMADRSLTLYDNTDVNSGSADEEVFLYDASTGHLLCASCDPSGARPVGLSPVEGGLPQLVDRDHIWTAGHGLAANIPGWTSYELDGAVYQSRYLSDS